MILLIGKHSHIMLAWQHWKKFVVSIMGGNMDLSRDLREFVAFLNSNKVRYLIIGGYAVALHGHPRYTKDLDVWIERTPTNAKRMLKALQQFGFGSLGLKEKDFIAPNQVVQFGNPPNRIEIFTTLKGVDFKKCFVSRVQVKVGDTRVNFIDLKNLKRNKRAVGRLQDLADLENLA